MKATLLAAVGTSGGGALAFTGPSTATVEQGRRTTAAFQFTRSKGGKPEAVQFSVLGLPAGLTATFSPASCKNTCQTLMTLAAAIDAPPGDYSLIVKAQNARDLATMSLLVSVAPSMPLPSGLIEGAFFISPTGNDTTGDGSEGNPWLTVGKFNSIAAPGDTCYMRGGTYTVNNQITLSASGSAGGGYITLLNYPSETPILNASGQSESGGFAVIRADVIYWHFYGLEIKESTGYGIRANSTNHIIVENCNVHHNLRLDPGGANIGLEAGNNNQIINCDAHHCAINQSSGTGGDGISMAGSTGAGNVIRGNRCWRNYDDGIDLWEANGILVEGNWSWENGLFDNLTRTTGNGVGFKLAGAAAGDGNHDVRRNLAWKNGDGGIDHNSSDVVNRVYNNSTWDNGNGFGFLFDTAVAHILRNNVAHSDSASTNASTVHDHNTWNGGGTLTDADFQTLDFTANTGPRQPDGSLPASNFLRLAGGSDLIDAGVDVGLPFNGSAPDMGAYET